MSGRIKIEDVRKELEAEGIVWTDEIQDKILQKNYESYIDGKADELIDSARSLDQQAKIIWADKRRGIADQTAGLPTPDEVAEENARFWDQKYVRGASSFVEAATAGS